MALSPEKKQEIKDRFKDRLEFRIGQLQDEINTRVAVYEKEITPDEEELEFLKLELEAFKKL